MIGKIGWRGSITRWTRSTSAGIGVAAVAVLVAVLLPGAGRGLGLAGCFRSARSRLVARCFGCRKGVGACRGRIPGASREGSRNLYWAVAPASKRGRVSLDQDWIDRGLAIACLKLPSRWIGRRRDPVYCCCSARR